MLKAERVWVLLRLSRRSSLDDETIYPPTCEPQARANVFEFEVGHLLKVFLGERPFARRSRTSLTRIHMPRMQGRPPHCSESTVTRSASLVTPPPYLRAYQG